MGHWRPGVAVLVAALALGGAGCSPDPVQGPGTPSASASQSPTADATAPLTGDKRAKGATLPKAIEEWTVQRSAAPVAGQTTRLYVKPDDSKSVLRATLSTTPLTTAALDAVLPQARPFGPARCGALAGGPTLICYVPLAGGSLSLTGTVPLERLGALTLTLYDALG